MRVVKRDVPDSEIHLYLIGDTHVGTKYHADKELQKTVDKVKNDPAARWIGMGDHAEFITPSDPRWQQGAISEWVSPDNIAYDQLSYFCQMISPIADKCDGLLYGNHDDDIKKHHHIDVQKIICDKLGVENLSYTAYVRYQFRLTATRTATINAVVTHGAGAAITRGAKLNRLERFMNNHNAHIFGHGHVHEIILHPGMPYLDVSQHMKLKNLAKQGAMTGCYFRTYTQDVESSYGEKKNYPPTMIGSPMFTISFDDNANPEIRVTK